MLPNCFERNFSTLAFRVPTEPIERSIPLPQPQLLLIKDYTQKGDGLEGRPSPFWKKRASFWKRARAAGANTPKANDAPHSQTGHRRCVLDHGNYKTISNISHGHITKRPKTSAQRHRTQGNTGDGSVCWKHRGRFCVLPAVLPQARCGKREAPELVSSGA